MTLNPRFVTAEQQPPLLFSVCTLVASEERYQRMLNSFEKFGFDEDNSEFIAIDNRNGNSFDGYSALRAFVPEFKGKYILFTHDDIELVSDGAKDLERTLGLLDLQDPRWTLAGNSGWSPDQKHLRRHMEDVHKSRRDVSVPTEVMSLDENFLVLPRARLVLPSLDLSGFHLFATDLCQQARCAGGAAYLIPFYLRHHSGGRRDASFEKSARDFRRKYSSIRTGRMIRTPSTDIYFGAAGEVQRYLDLIVRWFRRKKKRAVLKLASTFSRPVETTGNTTQIPNREVK